MVSFTFSPSEPAVLKLLGLLPDRLAET
jgi:hypothetical protein